MDVGLRLKRALVTGFTAGIGFAAAQTLAREGASVIVNRRTAARVDAAVAQLRVIVPDGQVQGIVADVSTAAGCQRLIDVVAGVDVLINNMDFFEPKPFGEISDQD